MTVAMCRFFFNRWAAWGPSLLAHVLFLLTRVGLEVYTGLHGVSDIG